MKGINLVPYPRRHAAAARKRARRWCWGVAGYAALVLTAYVAGSAALTVESDDKSAMLERTTRQIEELNIATTALKPQLAEAHAKLSVARTVGDQPDWSLLLTILSSTIDDEIVLTSTKLDVVAETLPAPKLAANARANDAIPAIAQPTMLRLTLQGMGRSQAAVTQFVLRLERLGLFERVDLARSIRQSVGSIDANVFRVECLLQRSGKPPTGGRSK